MNNAELYEKSNSLQKHEAIKCLDEYGQKITWKQFGDRVLDIGCGDGGVTSILKSNYMPTYFSRVVGCDISENMIAFANEYHGDRRTEFMVLDIEGRMPEALVKNFDHIVSFNALHWIRNQKNAFRNIYNLLACNGDCLLLFMGHMPIFDVYRKMARRSKWKPWLADVDHYVSPYHDSREPEKEITNMLTKIGFKDIDVIRKNSEFVYNDESKFREAVAAINPFNIPKELINDFLEDYVEIVTDMSLLDRANNNIKDHFRVNVSYNSLVVYARKSAAVI